jgi:hypothetical protein
MVQSTPSPKAPMLIFKTKDNKDETVVTVHIERWDVTRILVDNGSQARILFLSAFNKMGFDRK